MPEEYVNARPDPAHSREIGVGGLNHKMIMVGHQTVGMEDPRVSIPDVSKQLEKCLAIRIREKDAVSIGVRALFSNPAA